MKTVIKTILIGIAVITFIQLFPVQCWGQENPWLGINLEKILNTASWRLGPFRGNAAFILGDLGFNSDIYFGGRPNPVPDYSFTAGPDVNVFLPLRKGIVVDIAENPRYVYYYDTKKDRAFNNDFKGQLHIVSRRWYFQGGGHLVDAQERLSTELNLHVRRRETDLAGQAYWQVSKGSGIALKYHSYDYIFTNPDDVNIDIAANLDRKEQFINFSTYFKQTSKWRYYLDAQYGTYDFKQTASIQKNARSYSLYTGVEFFPPPTERESTQGIWGIVNLGYQRIDIRDPGRKDYGGLAGRSSVVFTPNTMYSFNADFSRALQFSAYSGLDYYIQTVYRIGLTRSLTRRIRAYGNAAFNRNDYAHISGAPSGEALLDRYATYSLGLRLRMKKDLELSLNSSFGKRNSSLAGRPHSNNLMIGLTLIYGDAPVSTTMGTDAFSR